MMRKWFVSAVSAACLLGVIGGTVIAGAGSTITVPETFTLVGSSRGFALVQASGGRPAATDPGDVLIYDLLLNDTGGADVGKARAQCTIHIHRWEICTYTWSIAERGEIVAEGAMPPYAYLDTPPLDLAVTGGTGEFTNVRGTVHIEVLDGGERDTFNLIP
jgi:hypothetical protein